MIDPKKIEEWKRLAETIPVPVEVVGGGDYLDGVIMSADVDAGGKRVAYCDDDFAEFAIAAREAIPALIAEVERYQIGQKSAVFACWNCGADLTATEGTYRASLRAGTDLAAVMEQQRALLREIEWGGKVAEQEGAHICPVCGAYAGLKHEPVHGQHAPDCRLAAALRG